jgi:hypothetical protein
MRTIAISADTGFWTYVDWNILASLSELYTSLKPVTLFLNPSVLE